MDDSQLVIYQSEDGQVKIDVRLENENVWLTQMAMAKLFETTKQNISFHINNVLKEGELTADSVVKESFTTAADGKNYKVFYYSLDMIVAVGYRVKSKRGTQFRIWATRTLKDYMIKGYALDTERMKNLGGGVYFEELLGKIRDIRSSEKVFWQKVLALYATSVDYDPKSNTSRTFFKMVQNKMHYAVSGQTAEEIVYSRADHKKSHLGLTSFLGKEPTKEESEIAKNYLSPAELDALNRLVSAYLDVAEINALSRVPMRMEDWSKELDSFLKMTRQDILSGKGFVSHEEAFKKAHEEYDLYQKGLLSPGEKDYLDYLNQSLAAIKKK
jgi:hypothetical protein